MQPSRRSATASILLCVMLLTAGCGAILGDAGTATSIHVVNQDNVEHAVVVEIAALADDPTPAYAAGRTLDAESDVELDPFEETGEYELTVTVDGDSTVHTHEFTGETPASLSIDIDNAGTVTVGSDEGERTP